MKYRRILQIAVRQLQINKTRSLFAVIALSVGITAVIIMAAFGNGARIQTLRQLEEMGTNLITINAGKVMDVMKRKDKTDRITTLRMKDCEAIISKCPSVKDAVPSLSGNLKIKYRNNTTNCMVNGVTAPYFSIKNFEVQYGEVFTPTEDNTGQRVVVLGSLVNESLFNSKNSVGKTILIRKVPFTVVGVLKSKGVDAQGADLDVQALIPINTALRRVYNADYLNRIFIQVKERSMMKAAEDEIITVLREQHKLDIHGKENDFTVDNQITAIETSEQSSRSFNRLIIGVSALALVVGGIGILAVMLLSVRIRNSEIGLRMSVGAKRQDIVKQFMAESVILGFGGGVLGITVGLLICGMMSAFSAWQIAISPSPVIISLVISLATGLIFGVFPARKAAMADPIVALQKE